MPIEEAKEGEEEGSEIYQRVFTIKDAHNTLDAIKCEFLKKSGLGNGVVKSIKELDCVMNMISYTCGKQFFSSFYGFCGISYHSTA